MTDWRAQRILVLGLGLTGVSVVRYMCARGARVRAYDTREAPPGRDSVAGQWPDVAIHTGDWQSAWLDDIDMVVASPGLDLGLPVFAEAAARAIPVIGDVEVFARDNTAPVLAVTGSNGKSTVVTLLEAAGRACGQEVVAAGNIGLPVLDALDQGADAFVLELSSFQLDLIDRLPCMAATILNITPDHMDRHAGLEAYAAAKAKIFAGAGVAVANADDPLVLAALPAGIDEVRFGSIDDARYRITPAGALAVDGAEVLAPTDLHMVGRHNMLNAAAVLALADAAGWPRQPVLDSIKAFPGLAHRCQWVADVRGVRWINDSKGTNVGATLAAIDGLDGPVVLLAGGQAKGGDFRPLREVLRRKGRAAVLFGEDAIVIERHLADSVAIHRVDTLRSAVRRADQAAQPGDCVLLSPGCASFDQFSGYEERGAEFVRCVEELAR